MIKPFQLKSKILQLIIQGQVYLNYNEYFSYYLNVTSLRCFYIIINHHTPLYHQLNNNKKKMLCEFNGGGLMSKINVAYAVFLIGMFV